MPAKRRTMADIMSAEEAIQPFRRLEEIYDTPVTLLSVEFREGQYGTFAVMLIQVPNEEEPTSFSTSGYAAIRQLKAVRSRDFPLEITPSLEGSTIVLR